MYLCVATWLGYIYILSTNKCHFFALEFEYTNTEKLEEALDCRKNKVLKFVCSETGIGLSRVSRRVSHCPECLMKKISSSSF